MQRKRRSQLPMLLLVVFAVTATLLTVSALAQFPDKTRNPNAANEGINKSLTQQIGAGRGNNRTLNSSLLYHRSRSVSRSTTRPPALPA